MSVNGRPLCCWTQAVPTFRPITHAQACEDLSRCVSANVSSPTGTSRWRRWMICIWCDTILRKCTTSSLIMLCFTGNYRKRIIVYFKGVFVMSAQMSILHRFQIWSSYLQEIDFFVNVKRILLSKIYLIYSNSSTHKFHRSWRTFIGSVLDNGGSITLLKNDRNLLLISTAPVWGLTESFWQYTFHLGRADI